MLRVVVDTNVLVSAILSPKGNPNTILQAWREGVIDIVLSSAILDEVQRVLHYKQVQQYSKMTEQEIGQFLSDLEASSVFTEGKTPLPDVTRDPEDEKFLVAAVEAQAEYLVTGDSDLTTLKTFRGIRIMTPREFVQVLKR